jgi:hypothetical protein
MNRKIQTLAPGPGPALNYCPGCGCNLRAVALAMLVAEQPLVDAKLNKFLRKALAA